MAKEIFCSFGVHADAVAGWIGTYGGENSPANIARGLFAGEVATPRLLQLFDRFDIKTSWYIPGHTIETFPEQMKAVAEAGHEIGLHGYTHENPIDMTPQQEEDVLDKCIDLVTTLAGRRPTGYVAPWWEFSPASHSLLMKKKIKYDHSLPERTPCRSHRDGWRSTLSSRWRTARRSPSRLHATSTKRTSQAPRCWSRGPRSMRP